MRRWPSVTRRHIEFLFNREETVMHAELVRRARSAYRSLHGVVVVSPRLISDLADAIEALEAEHEEDAVEFIEFSHHAAKLYDEQVALRRAAEQHHAAEGEWQLPSADDDHVGEPVE